MYTVQLFAVSISVGNYKTVINYYYYKYIVKVPLLLLVSLFVKVLLIFENQTVVILGMLKWALIFYEINIYMFCNFQHLYNIKYYNSIIHNNQLNKITYINIYFLASGI